MKPFHGDDGYVDMMVESRQGMVELFVATEGEESAHRVHIPARMAASLAFWLLWNWIWGEKLGLASRRRLQAARSELLAQS